MDKKKVLILGGSGYTGQYLAQEFSKLETFSTTITYTTHPIQSSNFGSVEIDFTKPDSLEKCLGKVINFRGCF